MKKLTIIIPHYKEKEEVLEFNLRMISLQQDIDFNDIEVVIVNDGPEAYIFSDEYLKSFKNVSIKQINTPENVGPGLSRQYGVDNTKSEYIMFIDSDDGLSSVVSLYNYLKAARDHKDADLIEADFIYETFESIESPVLKVERNNLSKNTWLHSKMFRRKFLEKYDIRFFKDIRLSEDVAFCTIMTVKNIKRYYVPYDCYFYKTYNNPESLTKAFSDDKIRLSHIDASIKSYDFCREHKERYNDLEGKLFRTLVYCYFLTFANWEDINNKEKFDDMVLSMFVDNFDIYETLNEEGKYNSYKNQLEDYISTPYLIMNKKKFEELKNSTYETMEYYFREKLKKFI